MRERLLLLYPRAWRERYGDEFLATLGTGPLRASEVIDIVRGALDAWFSSDVRKTTNPALAASSAGDERRTLLRQIACAAQPQRRRAVTPRDGLIGAAVLIAATWLLQFGSVAASHNGLPGVGTMLKDLAFPLPFTVSMPFWLMKGSSWRAQTLIVGITTFLLIASAAWSQVH